ncbi:MAG TPA: hypothetical protein VHZ99_01355 [Steroidobacteraceae bacterium]|jgi:DNA-binding transcriptional ArsR family regulator|nr:hypothetical protein [Steroidobacteraceae bacterium]
MSINGPEPRFARIAAAIGDPTRARMLSYLLGNEHATAGEMAHALEALSAGFARFRLWHLARTSAWCRLCVPGLVGTV